MNCCLIGHSPAVQANSVKRPMDERVEGFLLSRRISCLNVSASLVACAVGMVFLATAVSLFFKSFFLYGFTPSQSTQYMIQTVFFAGGLTCLFLFVKGVIETTYKICENIEIQDT